MALTDKRELDMVYFGTEIVKILQIFFARAFGARELYVVHGREVRTKLAFSERKFFAGAA